MDALRIIEDFAGVALVVLGILHISMIGPTILNVPMIIVGIFLVYMAEVKRLQNLRHMKENN
jgi:hypothetical protein